ncbi:sulfate adenylyltransferase subunit CysN [Oleisolibacter albus]|uniref:sulfate adenylyltransferase subunit CysN n=1 Tax=Oleisolibacter albus TaxID=2171757 RepID=UPI000DF26969|nr:sulfate adenylyltransferase subunit CysN [Oleisolibacter albus]
MRAAENLTLADVEQYLHAHQHKSLLRFITCGSVDDGKSSLIGRLLYESKMLFEDQLAALEADSRKVGTRGGELDFALLVDGLAAEREQGITIDVAYRFFATDRRKFIVADTPGHEQYTRNMVTGASTADLAVILIDARKGVLTQTRRHSFLVSLLGIRHVVLAVNKMDLVGFDRTVFERIVAEYRAFAGPLGFAEITPVPLSAVYGDNVVSRSPATPWYRGPALLEHLEQVEVAGDPQAQPFRLPVQWVNRPNLDFRGFSGLIAAGRVRPGDRVRVLPGGTESRVARIVTYGGDLDEAVAGQSVTLTLTDEIDISRGDVLCAPDDPAWSGTRLEAALVWMAEKPMVPGRSYLLKGGTRTALATLAPEARIDVNTLERTPAEALALNEIGLCLVTLDQAVALDAYDRNRETGGFILIDRVSNETVAAGMVRQVLAPATNIQWQALDVDKRARAGLKGQRPCVLWFTGLSGAGKSTIANLVEKKLFALRRHTMLLDGDNVRHGLNRDLGFDDASRVENIRRVAEVSKLMVEAGLITLVSFISPFRAERALARSLMGPGEFLEVFVDTDLAVAEARDVKGLYRRARAGEIRDFTGIDSPYEPPEAPDIHLRTAEMTVEEAADRIIAELKRRGLLETDLLIDGAAI